MFCPKCGKELAPDAAFCPACGAKVEMQAPAAEPAPAQQPDPAPAQQPAPAPAPAPVNVKLPPIPELIQWGVAVLAFIFSLLPIFKYAVSVWGMSYSESFTILTGNMFSLNFLLGMAKIFTIINIFIFAAYVVTRFLDINKYVKLPFDLKKLAPLAYFGLMAVTVVFILIGSLIATGCRPAFCWYVEFILCAAGWVMILKPDLLDKIFKK